MNPKIAVSLVLLKSMVILECFLIIGCSSTGGGFFTTRYQSVVAYFNTYYNAKKTFDEAIREIERTKPKTSETNLFVVSTVPQAARTKFLSTIEKCSKIIQFYPQSDLVDDALLMIGKSYYHLNELLPARKKFTELLENFPKSDLFLEAKLGLGKTHYANQKNEDALSVLESLVAESITEEEDDIAIESLLLEGQISFDQQNYSQAISSYLHAVEILGNDQLLAIVAYRLALCYELNAEAEAASKAYLHVLDFDPPLSLEYQSRVRAAVMFSKAGNFKRAFELLAELDAEQLSVEQQSFVELERGNIYRTHGENDKALTQYRLVDSLYKRTDAAAKSHYQSALLHEQKLFDLQQAKLHYDKAKTEFPQSEITPAAVKKSEILGRYLALSVELAKYDSLLQAALHPELYSHPTDTLQPDSSEANTIQGLDQNLPDSLKFAENVSQRDSLEVQHRVPVPLDTIHSRRAANQFALGILFLVDFEQADSSSYWLTTLLREYPDSKFSPQALYALAEVYRSTNDTSAVDSLHHVLLSKYPDSEYSLGIKKLLGQPIRSVPSDSVEILYERAEKSLESGNARAALDQFKKIARDYKKTSFAAKARYAVGWLYENVLVNNDSALTHYQLLVEEEPVSVYAERVRPKLAARDNLRSGENPQSIHGTENKESVPAKLEGKKDRKEKE